MEWLIFVFIAIGLIFQALGSISLHRFPDAYTRMHGTTKCTTFGSIFIYLAVISYGTVLFFEGKSNYAALSIHTAIAMCLILLTSPVSSHAIARAAHRSGIMPARAVVDRLQEAEKSRGQGK